MSNLIIQSQYCYDYVINQIPMGLLLYSHIPASVLAIMFGLYLIFKNRSEINIHFFVVCLGFALWALLNLLTWFVFLGERSVMFTWSLIDMFGIIFFVFSYFFLYAFITKKNVPFYQKIVGFLIILPTVFWTLGGYNLTLYDGNICEASESVITTSYLFVAQALLILSILIMAAIQYKKSKDIISKKEIIFASIGVLLFLSFFLSATFLVSAFSESDLLEHIYNYEIYGLFGMPVLLGFLMYLVVKYKTFNVKIFATQALVWALWILIISILFVAQTPTTIIIVGVTGMIAVLFGFVLINSVKREIRQREEIAELAKKLEKSYEAEKKANEELEQLDKTKNQFLLLIQHNLRTPLTSMVGYADLLLNGAYGKQTKKTKEVIEKFEVVTKNLIKMVNDFLDIAQFQLGKSVINIKQGVDLSQMLEEIVTEMKFEVDNKGIYLKLDKSGDGFVIDVDQQKLKAALVNVIHNCVKYTMKGGVSIKLERNNFVKVIVKDTGIGISPEGLKNLFSRIFERGKDATKTSTTGSGIGLYLASQIIKGHGGKIWAESEGPGKGSTFYIELPKHSNLKPEKSEEKLEGDKLSV